MNEDDLMDLESYEEQEYIDNLLDEEIDLVDVYYEQGEPLML